MGYVKSAEDVSGSVGSPFLDVPGNLVWPSERPRSLTRGHVSSPAEVSAQGVELCRELLANVARSLVFHSEGFGFAPEPVVKRFHSSPHEST